MLNETLFRSLPHTRVVLEAWRADYNHTRPNSRLGWMSPAIYAAARRFATLRSADGSADRRHHRPDSASPNARFQAQLDKSGGNVRVEGRRAPVNVINM